MKPLVLRGSIHAVKPPEQDGHAFEVVLRLKGTTESPNGELKGDLSIRLHRAQAKDLALGDIFEVTMTKAQLG